MKRRTYPRRSYRRRAPRRGRARTTVTNTNAYNGVVKSKGPASGLYNSATKWVNAAYKGYSIGAKAYKLGSMALGMLNAEKKYYDITSTAVTPSTPATSYTTVSLVSALPVGDDASSRDGCQIRLKSMYINIFSTFNSSATNTQLRWLVVLDRRVVAASTPGWTDIYDSTSVVSPFINIEDQWKRFKILRSGIINLNTNNAQVNTNIYIPCSLPVRYNTSNAVIMNNIWLIIASNEATNTPSVAYRYRIRFYDN